MLLIGKGEKKMTFILSYIREKILDKKKRYHGCVAISSNTLRCMYADPSIFKIKETQGWLEISNISNSAAPFTILYEINTFGLCDPFSRINLTVNHINSKSGGQPTLSSSLTPVDGSEYAISAYVSIPLPTIINLHPIDYGLNTEYFPSIKELQFNFNMQPGTAIGISNINVK